MHEQSSGDILSCVVYTHPGMGADVAAAVAARSGTEVVAGVAESKLVVTIEDTPTSRAADVLAGLNAVPGVINTVLVYHCETRTVDALPDQEQAAPAGPARPLQGQP